MNHTVNVHLEGDTVKIIDACGKTISEDKIELPTAEELSRTLTLAAGERVIVANVRLEDDKLRADVIEAPVWVGKLLAEHAASTA